MKKSLIYAIMIFNMELLQAQEHTDYQKEILAEIQGATAAILFSKRAKVKVEWHLGIDDLKTRWPKALPKYEPFEMDKSLDWSKDPSFGEPDKILVLFQIFNDGNGGCLGTSQCKVYGDKLTRRRTSNKVATDGLHLSLAGLKKQLFPNPNSTGKDKQTASLN